MPRWTAEEKKFLLKFGANVRKIRAKRDLSQQALSEKANLEYKYIQRIEGKNPPSIGLLKLISLSQALRVSYSKLLDI